MTSMTSGLEPYPGGGRRPPQQAHRPQQRHRRTSLGSLLVIGLGLAMAAGWVALGVAALIDYPHAEEYPDPVGAGLEAMFDVVVMVTGAVGAICALGGAIARAYGRRLLCAGLLAASGLSPVVVVVIALGWVSLTVS